MDNHADRKPNVVLNYTLDQLDLVDIYKTAHSKIAECTFFSSAHGIFSRIDHDRPQTSCNKFKRTEIISSIFSITQWHETRNQIQE